MNSNNSREINGKCFLTDCGWLTTNYVSFEEYFLSIQWVIRRCGFYCCRRYKRELLVLAFKGKCQSLERPGPDNLLRVADAPSAIL